MAKIMEEQRQAGVIEEVPEEVVPEVGKTYYMPHQAVVREDKSTAKLRVVYDASSKSSGESLNECLELLPSKFTDLFSVLVQF